MLFTYVDLAKFADKLLRFSETWKDSPDFALYLAELSASSLEKLSKSYKGHERWVYNSIYESFFCNDHNKVSTLHIWNCHSMGQN